MQAGNGARKEGKGRNFNVILNDQRQIKLVRSRKNVISQDLGIEKHHKL